MSALRLTVIALAACLTAATLGGCASKVTKSNYDQVKPGMTLTEALVNASCIGAVLLLAGLIVVSAPLETQVARLAARDGQRLIAFSERPPADDIAAPGLRNFRHGAGFAPGDVADGDPVAGFQKIAESPGFHFLSPD